MKRLASCWLLCSAAPLAAQQPAGGSPPAISLTQTAAELARNGAANHEARVVLAAAEILRVVERGTNRIRQVDAPPGPTGPWEGPMSVTALLQLASRIATERGDWDTAEYAAKLLQLPDTIPSSRGASGGPVWADAYLGGGQEATYTIEFDGGQSTNLLQVSAGKAGSALECTLHEGGAQRSVARFRSLAGTCSIEWRQASRGQVTLRIRNAGAATYYVVSSN